MFFQKKRNLLNYLGYHDKLIPIICKSFAGFLLRISENSACISLALLNITMENFTSVNIYDFFKNLPKHISFEEMKSFIKNYIRPFVSMNFYQMINDEKFNKLVAIFFQYYFTRLPILFAYCRYDDWPSCKGPNDENLKEIAIYALSAFEEVYPSESEGLFQKSSMNKKNIFRCFFECEQLAKSYKYNDSKLQEFVYGYDQFYYEFSNLYEVKGNADLLLECIFQKYFEMFWNSFKFDYLDTLLHWSYANGFKEKNLKRMPKEIFWKALDKRIDDVGRVLDNE